MAGHLAGLLRKVLLRRHEGQANAKSVAWDKLAVSLGSARHSLVHVKHNRGGLEPGAVGGRSQNRFGGHGWRDGGRHLGLGVHENPVHHAEEVRGTCEPGWGIAARLGTATGRLALRSSRTKNRQWFGALEALRADPPGTAVGRARAVERLLRIAAEERPDRPAAAVGFAR